MELIMSLLPSSLCLTGSQKIIIKNNRFFFLHRIFWILIFLTGLILSVYLSMDAFIDWRQNMIITRYNSLTL